MPSLADYGLAPICGGSEEAKPKATSLTTIQIALLVHAASAKAKPNARQGWTEQVVLRQAKQSTLDALERKGLVESYFVERADKIRYRLTPLGEQEATGKPSPPPVSGGSPEADPRPTYIDRAAL